MGNDKIVQGIERNIAALEKRIHTCGDKSGIYQKSIDKLNVRKQEVLENDAEQRLGGEYDR